MTQLIEIFFLKLWDKDCYYFLCLNHSYIYIPLSISQCAMPIFFFLPSSLPLLPSLIKEEMVLEVSP